MTVSTPCTVLVMGRHSTGKRTIASNYIGKGRDDLVERKRWVSQMKGTKDNITLQGLPEEHGRMSAYRQRIQAINESQAFVVVVRNNEPVHYQYYQELVTKNIKEGSTMGPFVVIAGYIEDAVPVINPGIADWAASGKAKVELINMKKLSKKDAAESKKLENIINSLVATAQGATAAPAVETVTPTGNGTPQPVVVAPKVEKVDQPTQKPQPQPSVISKALNYLVKGGSVA